MKIKMFMKRNNNKEINEDNFLSKINNGNYIGPTNNSNWVVPNRILASGNPGHYSENKHEKKIKKLIDNGIDCFVCLQPEGELRYFNPYFDTAREYGNEIGKEIEILRLEIEDFSVAVDEDVEELIDDILERYELGKNILIHCWSGSGRTGTIVSLLISRIYDVDAQTALLYCSKLHKQRVNIPSSDSPQDESQFNQVKRLVKKWRRETND
eukprot:TRINITY_DN5936_c0_g2_i1.p1 TRINITY_DN5936_c0_g2~~TRINITY_DN5936_c0_g2_i1.p1  ORF type:complete len:211 (-),score=69.26 TRINITY_DN5936_c0_g2_i1:119-751(-)